MNFDRMWNLLDSIQSQVRAFDATAQVAIAVNGILAGFVAAEIIKAAEYGGSGAATAIFSGLNNLRRNESRENAVHGNGDLRCGIEGSDLRLDRVQQVPHSIKVHRAP